jgi:hypothetical protein
MNGYTAYRLWWYRNQAQHSLSNERSVDLQFEDHINSMPMSELFFLFERIADGEYDGFLAAYKRETERLKELAKEP